MNKKLVLIILVIFLLSISLVSASFFGRLFTGEFGKIITGQITRNLNPDVGNIIYEDPEMWLMFDDSGLETGYRIEGPGITRDRSGDQYWIYTVELQDPKQLEKLTIHYQWIDKFAVELWKDGSPTGRIGCYSVGYDKNNFGPPSTDPGSGCLYSAIPGFDLGTQYFELTETGTPWINEWKLPTDSIWTIKIHLSGVSAGSELLDMKIIPKGTSPPPPPPSLPLLPQCTTDKDCEDPLILNGDVNSFCKIADNPLDNKCEPIFVNEGFLGYAPLFAELTLPTPELQIYQYWYNGYHKIGRRNEFAGDESYVGVFSPVAQGIYNQAVYLCDLLGTAGDIDSMITLSSTCDQTGILPKEELFINNADYGTRSINEYRPIYRCFNQKYPNHFIADRSDCTITFQGATIEAPEPTVTWEAPGCKTTDNGENIFKRDIGNNEQCQGGFLTEHYCVDENDPTPKAIGQSNEVVSRWCPVGCYDGACKPFIVNKEMILGYAPLNIPEDLKETITDIDLRMYPVPYERNEEGKVVLRQGFRELNRCIMANYGHTAVLGIEGTSCPHGFTYESTLGVVATDSSLFTNPREIRMCSDGFNDFLATDCQTNTDLADLNQYDPFLSQFYKTFYVESNQFSNSKLLRNCYIVDTKDTMVSNSITCEAGTGLIARPEVPCEENDAGRYDYGKQGNTKGFEPGVDADPFESYDHIDFCYTNDPYYRDVTGEILREYYCEAGKVKFEDKDCPEMCQYGRCKTISSQAGAPGCPTGCLVGPACIPSGIRLTGADLEDSYGVILQAGQSRDDQIYCKPTGQLDDQIGLGAGCTNDYQCKSNECLDGECVSLKVEKAETSAIKKILCALKAVFTDETYADCVGVEPPALPAGSRNPPGLDIPINP